MTSRSRAAALDESGNANRVSCYALWALGVAAIEERSTPDEQVEVSVPMRDVRPWSPDDPFLYELEASTGADTPATIRAPNCRRRCSIVDEPPSCTCVQST